MAHEIEDFRRRHDRTANRQRIDGGYQIVEFVGRGRTRKDVGDDAVGQKRVGEIQRPHLRVRGLLDDENQVALAHGPSPTVPRSACAVRASRSAHCF
jgi:hypothetical protein